MWIIMTWQCISPEVSVKGFKKCCISSVLDKSENDMLCMKVKRMGMLGVSMWYMKTQNVKMEAERILHVLCTKCMKLRVIYFFSADILFLAGCLRFV